MKHGAATSFVPAPENSRDLRDAFGRFATGVTIVTAQGRDGCVAMTANSFASVSMQPPLVLWSPGRASSRYPVFVGAEHYAIHVLGAEQESLAFAVARDQAALPADKLSLNENGVPVLSNCLARFDCVRHAVHEAGDHAIIVGEVLRAEMRQGDPLAFFGGRVTRLDNN